MAITAVVVNVAASTLHEQRQALEEAGFTVLTASSFAEAGELLTQVRPDLLVAPVQLSDYNGIHLAIRALDVSPHTRAIILGYPDVVLQRDAATAGAVYLIQSDVGALVDAARQMFDTSTGRRRWRRVRVDGCIDAEVAHTPVRLIDVSHGGFRMESPIDAADRTEGTFEVHVPGAGVSAEARPVWMALAPDADRTICGASISFTDSGTRADWAVFVDSVLKKGDERCASDSDVHRPT